MIVWRGQERGQRDGRRARSTESTPAEELRERAARRARSRLRRYAAANGLDRLITLTYAVPQRDRPTVVTHAARFLRSLRDRGLIGPYVYVLEHHADGERFHVHLLTDRFIPKPRLAAIWGHGFVDVRKVRARRAGSGRETARRAARYLAKYVGKADESGFGVRSYEVRHGYPARVVERVSWSSDYLFDELVAEAGFPDWVVDWSAGPDPGTGPPGYFLRWDA